ncbi:hypothetical protein JEY40_30100 [Bradyrhizobium japonicum]|uniref:acylneuraminate cytidylyltransferase family protein n=1 Tax=Bradyrhizobium japonicum TaxID=375 RepID=UPI00200BA3D2|nr:hypothetical protein [Bradyrhizobium japonicum]UQD70210.1 hypothetical protein JEY40_30100 [Bradyrhizobium japonicum]
MADPGSDPCGEGECSRSFGRSRFDGGADASYEIICQGAFGVTLPTILAVIPARGGSKRIPRKNITLFHGKPMMAWPIGMLKSSGLVANILVSTDNEEVAEMARNVGAEVPFMRPASLSDDYTGTAAVTKHAVDWFVSNRYRPDLILTVYPTAVFVSADDIKSAVATIDRLNCEMVFSAVEFPSRIQRALFMTDDGRVRMAYPEYYSARSQDLPPRITMPDNSICPKQTPPLQALRTTSFHQLSFRSRATPPLTSIRPKILKSRNASFSTARGEPDNRLCSNMAVSLHRVRRPAAPPVIYG